MLFKEEKYNFQKVLNENSIQLKKTIKKCGEKNVSTSRAYYDAINKRKKYGISEQNIVNFIVYCF